MADRKTPPPQMLPEVHQYYESSDEAGRLFQGYGQLELARTQELILRHIPPPPAAVLDIGGGSGVYACWLARAGYEVHLVDAVPRHVEQALDASAAQPDHPLATCSVGDARRVDFDTASMDAVLLLGPLYHLTERDDRVAALREAHRLLHPGGIVLAAAISRMAPALDGLLMGFLENPEFRHIVRQDLENGQHRNPGNHPGFFTTAFLHLPSELKAEVNAAGFCETSLFSIEGVGALLDLAAYWEDPGRRAHLLDVLGWLESEPSALGITSHMLAVGRK